MKRRDQHVIVEGWRQCVQQACGEEVSGELGSAGAVGFDLEEGQQGVVEYTGVEMGAVAAVAFAMAAAVVIGVHAWMAVFAMMAAVMVGLMYCWWRQ